MTPDGERREEQSYPNTPQGRDQLVRETPEGTHVVMETGTYGTPLARAFQRPHFKVVLAEVREVRRRAGNDLKTDKPDAYELASQYRLAVIKEAYLPTEEEDNGIVESSRARLDRDYLRPLVFDPFEEERAFLGKAWADYNTVKPRKRRGWNTPRASRESFQPICCRAPLGEVTHDIVHARTYTGIR